MSVNKEALRAQRSCKIKTDVMIDGIGPLRLKSLSVADAIALAEVGKSGDSVAAAKLVMRRGIVDDHDEPLFDEAEFDAWLAGQSMPFFEGLQAALLDLSGMTKKKIEDAEKK